MGTRRGHHNNRFWTTIAPRRSRLGAAPRRLTSELLEDRRVLHGLTTGTGDGSLQVTVDGYGAFGAFVGGSAGDAIYDPIGSISAASTTFQSGVAFRLGDTGARQFLTAGAIGTTSGLPEIPTTGSTTAANSTFTIGGLTFELNQNVVPMVNEQGVQTGSLLTQNYKITNSGGTSQNFEMVRYIDGDLLFDGSLVDGGGRILPDGHEFLFETDAGGTGSTDTTFIGIDSNGGTIPATNHFEIERYSLLLQQISAGTALDGLITGDNNGDGFVDAGNEYDITLALRNTFSLAPGEITTYTTRTVFGSGTPEDVSIGLPAVESPDVSVAEGDAGLTDLVFPISLSEASTAPITVVYNTVAQTATSGTDYIPTSGTLTFLPDGPLTLNVTVQVVADLAGEADETFLLRLSDVNGGQIERTDVVGTILNDDVEASISDVTVIESNGGTSSAVFVISLVGDNPDPTSIVFVTTDNTANGGADYQPVGGTLSIPANAKHAFITVPIVGDSRNETTEDFFVSIYGLGVIKVGKGVGKGTIIDNDKQSALYVNDVQVTTTDLGVLQAVFTVALDVPSGRTVTVNYNTADNTSIANVDYLPTSGTLTFAPGVTTQHVTVPVLTSDTYYANELFYLQIGGATGAWIVDPQGVCTNVFAPAPPPEFFADDGGTGYAHGSGWTNVTNLVAYQMDYEYHAPGNGSGRATWSFDRLPPGPYEVFTRWVPFGNRATNAPYTILDDATALSTVRVNQQLAPTGDSDNGIVWQSLGTFNVASGTLRVRLSDDANGYVIADGVRIVPYGIPAQRPEIDVARSDRSILNNDASPAYEEGTSLGAQLLLTDSATYTYTIRNTGNANLTLPSGVQMLGDHAADFVVVKQPATTVAPGKSTTFEIVFRPSDVGLRQAVISIASNDFDESPYKFAIEGTGSATPLGPLAVHNTALALDVNGDSQVTPNDALIVINALANQSNHASALPQASSLAATAAATTVPERYLDVDGNGIVSARDVLMIINYLLSTSAAAQAASAASAAAPAATPQVQAFVVDQAVGEVADEATTDTFVAPTKSTPAAVPTSTAAPLTADTVEAVFLSATAVEDESDAELFAAM